MSKITRVKYFTSERKKLINLDNLKLYKKYRESNIIKNPDVKETTYGTYKNYFEQFLVYLAENWDNVNLYSDEFMENAIDIMEGFMSFCQEILGNHKKVINTKLSAVSSFYLWSVRRKLIPYHPFDKRLDRMKKANEEHIINSYFLDDNQVETINKALEDNTKYDIIDRLIWNIMIDSANRIGAIDKLTFSSFDEKNCEFLNIREKEGYHVEVAVTEKTRDLILQWKEQRKGMDNLQIDALFISRYGKEWRKMDKTTLQHRVNKIGMILQISDFHSHCIRKTKLNDIYEETGDLNLAAAWGNHKSTETTKQAYIKKQSKAVLRDKIREIMKEKNAKEKEKNSESNTKENSDKNN